MNKKKIMIGTNNKEKSTVKDYMTKDVITVTPTTPCKEVIKIMKKTGHDGFPVVNEETGAIQGIVTAYDLLLKDWAEFIEGVMSNEVTVAQEDMTINDASRVMFRHGISRLPVINKDKQVQGIITNTDMVRSHIERSTPNKVEVFQKTMEQLYGIKTRLSRKNVPVNQLRPTQDRIYADELQGRIYELERGLAEPTIVVKTGNRYILVDGHHRAVASIKLGYEEIDSYVIDLNKDIKIGMERTADTQGIHEFEDIHIIDDDQHPLIALTETIKTSKKE